MEIVAIIPARGGSKGIPRKNVQKINGIPLVANSIINARRSKYINRLFVSTDDAEIMDLAKYFGGEIICRPSEISTDTSSSESALLHALEYLENHEHYKPDLLVFIQCTSPLTQTEDIDGSIEELLNNNADTSFTVTDFHYYIWDYDELGNARGINHDKRYRARRQDKSPQYIETGSVYVMKVKGFINHRHRFFGKTVMHKIPTERMLEIDERVDLKIAEILLKFQTEKDVFSMIPEQIDAIFFDFDGVFTDNKVYVDQAGVESVMCNRSDGLAIELFKSKKIPIMILSKEKNDVVKARANKLKIEVLNGLDEKETILKKICEKNNYNLKNVIYVGNDINDLGCFNIVGCSVAVNDAYDKVKKSAKIILKANGGNGAVRELLDLLNEKIIQK